MLTRRLLLHSPLVAMLRPASVIAQEAGRVRRLGWLGNARPDSGPEIASVRAAFFGELANRGWIEGRNLVVENRFSEGVSARFPGLADELVKSEVELIVATSGPGTLAAKAATTTIPIVFGSVPSPVRLGLVASLAHPEANVTGLASVTIELIGKRFEFSRLLSPGMPAIAMLTVRGNPLPEEDDEAARVAAALGMRLVPVPANGPTELATALSSTHGTDGWIVLDYPSFYQHRKLIVDGIAGLRQIATYPARSFVEAGGLLSYAADQKDQYRRVAGYVDRILRGAKPADLPVELPTKFELVVNLRAAKAIGLTIAESILTRADEVLE